MMKPSSHTSEEDASPPARPWPVWVRAVASVLLLLHLTAVIAPPWTASARSSMSRYVFEALLPYIHAAYLDHGYQFFAPEPGPSHLIRYDVELADGSHVHGIMPNRKEQLPRLRYHRHFMLTEFLLAGPLDPQWEIEPDFRRQKTSQWQAKYCRGYANQLLEKFDGRRVTLYWRRHRFPRPVEVQEGMPLNDPRLFQERLLGTFQRNSS